MTMLSNGSLSLDFEDWDFVPSNDCGTNIRCFNVDSRSIIATVNQRQNKTSSTLNRAISTLKCSFLLDRRISNETSFRLDVRRSWTPNSKTRSWKWFQVLFRSGWSIDLCQWVTTSDLWRRCGSIHPQIRLALFIEYIPFTNDGERATTLLRSSENQLWKVIGRECNDRATHFSSRLKARWQHDQYQSDELQRVMHNIHKDVLRTDRICAFYGTSCETNANLQSLFHILTTYCASHPSVNYCQG